MRKGAKNKYYKIEEFCNYFRFIYFGQKKTKKEEK